MTMIQIEPISKEIGARIFVDAGHILDESVPEQILEALNKYGVLLFPEINLDDQVMASLSNRLGEMEAATVTADGSDANKLGLYKISLDKEEKGLKEYVEGNNYWHMDGTSYQVPGKATMLKCESPPKAGGETEFANLFAAYAALPEARKKELEGLKVIHSMYAVMSKLYDVPAQEDIDRWNSIFPDNEHPLVWRQKDGRRSLVIGSTAGGIAGMSEEEGKALLDELLEWCTQDQFTYQHVWQKGDMVIFNNPGLLHRSRPYNKESGRVLHRATVKGVEAISA